MPVLQEIIKAAFLAASAFELSKLGLYFDKPW